MVAFIVHNILSSLFDQALQRDREYSLCVQILSDTSEEIKATQGFLSTGRIGIFTHLHFSLWTFYHNQDCFSSDGAAISCRVSGLFPSSSSSSSCLSVSLQLFFPRLFF